MITASELLGDVRIPKWRGPVRVVSGMREEVEQIHAEGNAKRREAVERKRAARLRDRPLLVSIGKQLRETRRAMGHPRKVAAAQLGTTTKSLDGYERGEVAIPVRCWRAVRDVYGVDIAERLEAWRGRQ